MDYKSKPYLKIGRLIRNLRIGAGFAQAEFAKEIDVNNSYLSRIENGERRPSPKIMKRIAKVLPVSYEELVSVSGLISDESSEPVRESVRSTGKRIARTPGEVKEMISKMTPRSNARIVEFGEPASSVPRRPVSVYDRIPAGFFDEANVVHEYDHTEQVVLTEDELGYDPLAFALRVKGDSMVEAGIFENDIVIVSPSSGIANGDIAAVSYGNVDITLKKFHNFDNVIVLQPCNSAYPPITITNPEDVKVLGRVILVRRKLV